MMLRYGRQARGCGRGGGGEGLFTRPRLPRIPLYREAKFWESSTRILWIRMLAMAGKGNNVLATTLDLFVPA